MKLKALLLLVFLINTISSFAQDDSSKVKFEIYGFAMTDMGYDFKQINPNYFDVLRVTRLPSYKNQFAPDGKVYFGVRQTTFGIKGTTATPVGELKTKFEFDLFGVGVNEGQTTIHLRDAYGELGKWLVGQAISPFTDGQIYPNIVEYWGPTGMVFFRNIQLRFAPLQGANEVFIALERPGASGDQGIYEDRIELDSIKTHLPLPDFSAHYKRAGNWGHVQLAGILRSIKWKDIHTTGGYDNSGSVVGWGTYLSTVLSLGKSDLFRGAFAYGEGVENYMNDAPIDVGAIANPGNAAKPFDGRALPVTGIVAFFEHKWNDKFSTTIGYSSTHIENSEGGSPSAYKNGQYAIANVVSTPFKNMMVAAELQWGKRENFNDGFSSEDVKFQVSFRYNFSHTFYFDKK
ncbi:DcaP family trimeric outer membrane transporter [Solitalea koreensis]|uniref:Porin subfamily protein n=1 Tax=Solitalea koreensis TaxID=543615 RepID=A0A521C5C4_9SPHI|nr:DcaP family trimeric outer membrane transporter [Solitalea koreensis]SMO54624.1 hypothetical protein SAMN06265350_103222 [Solitalea koreensis]